MRFGFNVPNRGPLARPEHLVALARLGEDLGYETLYAPDHLVIPKRVDSAYPYNATGEYPGLDAGDALEQLTLLSYLAGATRTLRLVTSVMVVPHRPPVLAAKMLTTLDVLSGGRLVVGVGVGWMKEEFEALGLPPFEERGAVSDEYIRVFKELWTSDNPSFHGKYCSFEGITFRPRPVQTPHPPIWVGGESPAAIRRAATLGNGWYPMGLNPRYPMGTPDELSAGIERLRSAVRRARRDPSEVEVVYRVSGYRLNSPGAAGTPRLPFQGSPDQIADDVRKYGEMGVSELVVDFRATDDLHDLSAKLEEFATVVWPLV